ncbi:MAG: cytochrome c-type biogenesis protein CcmH [Ilumatobacteraceae bacterium]
MSGRLSRRWPLWGALVFVLVGFLAVGATRTDGPSTPEERASGIEARIACPVCQGESVLESRNTASESIRNRVGELVDEGDLTDDEIIGVIESSYGGRILLVPRASGFDALVWALPVAALICAVSALALTFRRWKREAAAEGDPTDEDRALVAAALASEDDAPPAERDR